jgi:ABC-type cobalamin/Fe3+-siderophores transport system ATPase subunit
VTTLLKAGEVTVLRGRRTVLHGVSLALRAGEALALVGPNAAGKSTLVGTLAGLLPVVSGRVFLQDRPFSAWDRDGLARAVALVTTDEEGPNIADSRGPDRARTLPAPRAVSGLPARGPRGRGASLAANRHRGAGARELGTLFGRRAPARDARPRSAWAERMVLLHHGRVVAEGAPDVVLQTVECSRAFDVAIRGHAVPGVPPSLL